MRYKRDIKLLMLGVVGALIVFGLSPVGASSANISHSYNAESQIPDGSLVGLDPQRQNTVELSNTTNQNQLLGVSVADNDSLIAVDETQSTVQVATSGIATTLVSNLNGDINVGDEVGVSPFDGIGMKAAAGSRVIGLAQTGFNGQGPDATSEKVTDKSGKTSEVKLGYVRVNIGVTTLASTSDTEALSSLQKLAKSLTGHTVSTLRIAISLIVTVVALVALVTLVYAAIYASIISVGRNPLAKYAVFRTLGSVISMALLTAAVTGITVVLLLR